MDTTETTCTIRCRSKLLLTVTAYLYFFSSKLCTWLFCKSFEVTTNGRTGISS